MVKNNFYDKQTDLTASKILIYQKYIKSYLPKVLMKYGKCFIADLFCGPGKNGDKDGSPLILLDAAKGILASPALRQKWQNLEVIVVFSDANRNHVDNLVQTLKQHSYPSEIKIIGPFCEKFKTILSKIEDIFNSIKEPKFFFLDPFTYSVVNIDQVKALIDTPSAEVLLFLPTFHSYRFKGRANEHPKLKKFLEGFMERGCIDYTNIIDFNESIRRRLLSYLDLKYVNSIGLDGGATKNALFYLTKHLVGMILMNKLVWEFTSDGMTFKTKSDNKPTLFTLNKYSDNYAQIKEVLINYIEERNQLTNVEIIDFVAQHCFTNKYANEILRDMKKQRLIDVEYLQTNKTRGFYIADNHWNNKLSIIKYIG